MTGSLRSSSTRIGARFGRYQVGSRLGSGAMAAVYLARLVGPHDFERLLALKIIHDHLVEEKEFVDLFLDEAKLAVRLSHPNIVHVYELGRVDDRLFLAIEYLHGQTLAAIRARSAERSVRIPYDIVAWVGAQAASALYYAHELTDDAGQRLGLAHRDVSPQNIFLTYDGQVKLIDFGIARAAGRIARTGQGKIRGKFRYMAPEQLLGDSYDHRVDLFALGATLYELAVGAPVFESHDETDMLHDLLLGKIPDPRTRVRDFPEELAGVLMHALAPEPENRHANGNELARDLEGVVTGIGLTEHKARLSEIVGELFIEEKAAQARAVADLRDTPCAVDDLTGGEPMLDQSGGVEPPGTTSSGLQRSLFATRSLARRYRTALAMIAPVLVLALSGVVWLAWRANSRTAGGGPAEALSSVIDVRVQPPVEASIRVGGSLVEQRPARVVLRKADKPIEIEVTASGFETAHLSVVPDRDQVFVVPLMRLQPDGAAASSSALDGAIPPELGERLDSGSRTGEAPGAAGTQGGHSVPTGVKSSQPKSSATGIVTAYPFP